MWRLRKSDYYRNSNFKLLAKLGCRNGRLGVKDSEMHLPVAVNVQMGDSFSDTVEMSKLADWLCGGSEKVIIIEIPISNSWLSLVAGTGGWGLRIAKCICLCFC